MRSSSAISLQLAGGAQNAPARGADSACGYLAESAVACVSMESLRSASDPSLTIASGRAALLALRGGGLLQGAPESALGLEGPGAVAVFLAAAADIEALRGVGPLVLPSGRCEAVGACDCARRPTGGLAMPPLAGGAGGSSVGKSGMLSRTIEGTGVGRGETKATFFPAGTACSPWAPRNCSKSPVHSGERSPSLVRRGDMRPTTGGSSLPRSSVGVGVRCSLSGASPRRRSEDAWRLLPPPGPVECRSRSRLGSG